MFPLRDHNPSGRPAYVTWALMAANILIFALQYPLFGDPEALTRFYADWALVPAQVSQGYGWHGVLSSMFLHGGLMHLGGNMLFLWIFGDNLEDEMGPAGFALFYLLSGIAAGLVHVWAEPGSWVPTVGASGAIAGVMGGYLLLYPRARVDLLLVLVVYVRILPVPAWLMLGLWFVLQFLGGLSASAEAGGVAYWAHAGGFVAGFAMALPLWLRRGGPVFWQRHHGSPPHAEARYRLSSSRIPRIPRRRG